MTADIRSPDRPPLRLWPGVVAVVVLVLAWFVVPAVWPEAGFYAIMVALAAGLAVVLWWLFLSRAPWLERVGVLMFVVAAVAVTWRLVHPSIENGAMGMMLPIYSIPVLSVALVAAVIASRRRSHQWRRAAIGIAVVLACTGMTLVRTGGMSGDGTPDFHWRWTETPEERLLASAPATPAALPAASPAVAAETAPGTAADAAAPGPSLSPAPGHATAPPTSAAPPEGVAPLPEPAAADAPAAWPGFRGPGRNGVTTGIEIATDWSRSAPVELWRRPIGPGWSSFAVAGRLAYTQEQRGEDEVVSCYDLATGSPVWSHRDRARFWESNAGAGPRATPTLVHGRVYTLGATGLLNALDARTGRVFWSRNAASDTGTQVPPWGFAGSPLVLDDLVVVATAGALGAYDRATGTLRWVAKAGSGGYSSPHFATLGGVPQVVLVSASGAAGVAPADGTRLWSHAWSGDGITQPAVLAGGDVLLGSGSGLSAVGLRRVAIARGADGWTVTERWTTTALKPYFSDFVVHQGHAYGFDGSILAAVDVETGTRKWKGGRYGHGQLVLLPDQGLLLVQSEEGGLALVRATPDRFDEVARAPAIEGKTWNHPVLAGDILLVRNGEEMAAFRLATPAKDE